MPKVKPKNTRLQPVLLTLLPRHQPEPTLSCQRGVATLSVQQGKQPQWSRNRRARGRTQAAPGASLPSVGGFPLGREEGHHSTFLDPYRVLASTMLLVATSGDGWARCGYAQPGSNSGALLGPSLGKIKLSATQMRGSVEFSHIGLTGVCHTRPSRALVCR